VTPLLFLAANAWILVYVFLDRPTESLIGLSIVAVGAALYFASQWGAPDEAPVSGPRP
jgi:APA family basic amino acid/polyamine antiporter